jgi:hypothetical protein
MAYEDFAAATRSQKIVVAHLEAKEKLKLFSPYAGAVYSRAVSHYVVGVKVNGTDLTAGASAVLSAGQYYYSPSEGVLYLRLSDSSDPVAASIYVTYRFFYSNIPCNLPSGVTSGDIVPYDSRIKGIGALKLELDYEQTGIALETNSSIALENTDGGLDNTFDTLVWENNLATFWSWNRALTYAQAKLIYRGLITDKSFTEREVRFTLKDELTKLRQTLPWATFSSADGNIESATDGKPKRLVLGRCDKLRTTGIDKALTGYALTGTVTGSADRNLLAGTVSGTAGASTVTGSGTTFTGNISNGHKIRIYNAVNEYDLTVNTVTNNTSLTVTGTLPSTFVGYSIRNLSVLNNLVTGTGTSFKAEVSPGDELVVTVGDETYKYEVETVSSDTQLLLGEQIEETFTAITGYNDPEVPYRRVNRSWHIAGHKLRSYSVTITDIINTLNIEVDDVLDIEAGDKLEHEGTVYTVERTLGNKIVLNQNIVGASVGEQLTKLPVLAAYVGTQAYVLERDFTVDNSATDAILVFDDLAEFNAAQAKNLSLQFTFTSGSTTVTTSSTVDLQDVLRPRDWVRANSLSRPDWYEVLSVSETSFTIRTAALSTFTGAAQLKSPDYISDSSVVTVDCLGLESDTGEWVRYPGQAAKWLLEEAGLTALDEASFTAAAEDCQYTLSLYYPATLGSDMPVVRDMVTDINKAFEYAYSILNSDKPEELEVLEDSDILGFSVSTKNNIYNSVALQYRPYVDLPSGSETFAVINLESDFVNEAIGKVEQLKVKSYLYYEADATVMAQRWLFFKSLTQTVVTISTKLNLALKALNDKLCLSLSRLYKRYGGSSKDKVGVINSITKDGANTVVQINDLGNIFNRVPAVAPDDASDYVAGALEIAKYGYVLDNDTETPDASSELELGNNLIG